MKTITVMQPYFMPYIGYFQLMFATDKFIVFDDVNYINRGWINRNRLLLNGAAHTFTLPLRAASQNKLICETELMTETVWRDKLLRTIRQAYASAPCYAPVFSMMESIIRYPSNQLDEFILNSLQEIVRYLSLKTEIVATSRAYMNAPLKGQERILDICLQEHVDRYINPIGGLDLYNKTTFLEQGIQLNFLRSLPIAYPQGKGEFVPWLSILDIMMLNEPPAVRQLIMEFDLV